jgi:DNA helicase-2/ATP-dependent DNA helicase PcrA
MTQNNKEYLADLNPEQHAAVTHENGPLLIVAGAGSGKTKTLTSRIAHLIHIGVAPERILAITFTNKAAKEMRDRAAKLLAYSSNPKPYTLHPKGDQPPVEKPGFIGTFHSWGVRFLKEEGRVLARREHFSIFDDDDTLKILKEICKVLDLDKEQYNPLMFRSRISAIKNELRNASELLETGAHMDEVVYKIFERYEAALTKNNAFDFDDLVEKPVRIFAKFPEILAKHQDRYDHILIDEYQDVNTSQYQLVKFLAKKHQNLSVVGDDAQSIYKFRGSDFRNFLRFDSDWPEAKVIKLEENYRSTSNILAAATGIIKNNKKWN